MADPPIGRDPPSLGMSPSLGMMASGVLDVLKSSPVVLAILVIIAFFWGGFGFLLDRAISAQHAERMLMLDKCLPHGPADKP